MQMQTSVVYVNVLIYGTEISMNDRNLWFHSVTILTNIKMAPTETDVSFSNESNESKFIAENEWMVRPCFMYSEEYDDCTSLKARFHQYFVHGETTDCIPWKRDLDSCEKWNSSKQFKDFKDLVEGERKRRSERLIPHYQNTVWKKRKEPPSDWNKPLPEWMQKENEGTYLAMKAEEMKRDPNKIDIFENRSLCVIS